MFSLGDEAIELARRAGLELDFWQQQALVVMLGVRPDGLWACFEYCELVPRQNGKGAVLEARALAGFFLLGEQLIMWSAHEYKTSIRAFRRMRTLIRRLGRQVNPNNDNLWEVDGILVKICNTNGEEGFERLDTEAELKFLARSKGSGRGFTGNLNIIDEALAYTEDQHAALMPTMSAVSNPQIVYTSTPPLTGTSGEILYQLRKRAEAGDDDSLGYRDWGMAGALEDVVEAFMSPHLEDPFDLDDEQAMAATNPALGIRISAAFIRKERKSMSLPKFLREIYGIWPRSLEATGGVIPADLWESRKDVASEAATPRVGVGVDAAPGLVSAAVAMTGLREDGLRHWQVLDHLPGTHWVVRRLREFRAGGLEFAAVGVDPTGPAGALIPDLEAAGFEVVKVSGQALVGAWGAFHVAVKEDQGRHIGQDNLTDAIRDTRTAPSGDAERFSRRRSDGDICPLVAVTIADHVHRTVQPKPEVPPWVAYV